MDPTLKLKKFGGLEVPASCSNSKQNNPMKKIVYCLLASMFFSLTACEVDEKTPDFVNVSIGYDDAFGGSVAYSYKTSTDPINVTFFVTGASTAEVVLINGSGASVKTQVVTPGQDGKCVVTYTQSELGITNIKTQTANCIINAGGLTKTIRIKLTI
jgi:hypothetical protein